MISKGRYIKKKNSAPYIGNVLTRQKHQETKLQRSNKAGRDKQEKAGKTKHHSRRVRTMLLKALSALKRKGLLEPRRKAQSASARLIDVKRTFKKKN